MVLAAPAGSGYGLNSSFRAGLDALPDGAKAV